MKKQVLFLAAVSFLGSCALWNHKGTENVNTDDTYVSLKGLKDIRNFEPHRDPAQFEDMSQKPAVSKDPNIIVEHDGSIIDCNTQLKTRTETFKGEKRTRFIIDKAGKLRCPKVRAMRTPRPWKVMKEVWMQEDEAEFAKFIKAIGESGCNTTDKCLSSSANPYRTEEEMQNVFYADCADFPYYLRAYFAYKNDLPFSVVSKVAAADGSEPKDMRTTSSGNIPLERISVPSVTGAARDFGQISLTVNDATSTATYRMVTGKGNIESDFYSPAIRPGGVRIGTAVYGVAGHAGIVYEIKENGEVRYMDAHPDNSVTRKSFQTSDFPISKIEHGGGFKNFREQRVMNPERNSNGIIVKGRVHVDGDGDHKDYSLEQYDSKNFIVANKQVRFVEWQRFRLSGGSYKINPPNEIANEAKELCTSYQARVEDIEAALRNNLHKKPHLDKLPENIFSAVGDWEDFSTPGRDLRLRNKVKDIVSLAKEYLTRFQERDPLVIYQGTDLKADMIAAFNKVGASCNVTYTKSDGSEKTLSFNQLVSRLPQISFDPFLCPEVRWGATSEEELATCKDGADKREWHKYTQFLRNNLNRDTKAFHGFSLEELRQKNASGEFNNSPKAVSYDVPALINAL